MMRSWLMMAAFLVATLATASRAQAQTQVFEGAGGPIVISPGGGPSYAVWYVTPAFGLSAPLVHGAYYPPYDYFAAYPMPARFYSGGYSNDFPFYGKPYGNPSTPWTWATMSAQTNPGSAYASRFNPW